jgi:hypothetical protein
VGTGDAHAQAAAAAPSAGPRVEALRAGYAPEVPMAAGAALSEAAMGPVGSRANGRIAAIVGGAAFVGGLLIGDDAGAVIAVTGLVVGLLGLWTWLG